MAVAYTGRSGTGQVVTYTTPPAQPFRLDLICFTIVCNGVAAEHHALVQFIDSSSVTPYIGQDWNVAPDGATVTYNFGIDLTSSACTVVTGMIVEHDLPNTVLAPKTQIILASVTEAGVTIAADEITNVVLYGEQITGGIGTDPLDAPPPLLSPTYSVA